MVFSPPNPRLAVPRNIPHSAGFCTLLVAVASCACPNFPPLQQENSPWLQEEPRKFPACSLGAGGGKRSTGHVPNPWEFCGISGKRWDVGVRSGAEQSLPLQGFSPSEKLLSSPARILHLFRIYCTVPARSPGDSKGTNARAGESSWDCIPSLAFIPLRLSPGSWNCHYFTLLSRSSPLVAGAALPWDNLGFPACAGKWKPLSSLWMETWDFPSQGLRAKSL